MSGYNGCLFFNVFLPLILQRPHRLIRVSPSFQNPGPLGWAGGAKLGKASWDLCFQKGNTEIVSDFDCKRRDFTSAVHSLQQLRIIARISEVGILRKGRPGENGMLLHKDKYCWEFISIVVTIARRNLIKNSGAGNFYLEGMNSFSLLSSCCLR